MARPKFNVLMYHQDDNKKERPTEVGALWALTSGPGFMLSLKRGLSIANLKGTRIVCLPVDQGGDQGGERDGSRGGDHD